MDSLCRLDVHGPADIIPAINKRQLSLATYNFRPRILEAAPDVCDLLSAAILAWYGFSLP